MLKVITESKIKAFEDLLINKLTSFVLKTGIFSRSVIINKLNFAQNFN